MIDNSMCRLSFKCKLTICVLLIFTLAHVRNMLHSYLYIEINNSDRAVVAMIVWYLDVQLPMQSVPIAIDIVSSNLDQGEVYNIM